MTDQFIQHDQQADAGKVYCILRTSNDEFTDAFCLETRPAAIDADTIRGSTIYGGKGTVDNSNMCKRLRRNIIQATADFRFESWF